MRHLPFSGVSAFLPPSTSDRVFFWVWVGSFPESGGSLRHPFYSIRFRLFLRIPPPDSPFSFPRIEGQGNPPSQARPVHHFGPVSPLFSLFLGVSTYLPHL